MNQQPKRGKHKFTEDECSRGGAEARWKERQTGVKLNHGMRWGKKDVEQVSTERRTEKETH